MPAGDDGHGDGGNSRSGHPPHRTSDEGSTSALRIVGPSFVVEMARPVTRPPPQVVRLDDGDGDADAECGRE